MSLQVEKLEKNMAKLTIEVSAEEFEKAVDTVYKRQKQDPDSGLQKRKSTPEDD